jgi:hypothetical protein
MCLIKSVIFNGRFSGTAIYQGPRRRITNQVAPSLPSALPPILASQFTPHMKERVEQFYFSLKASVLWVLTRL